MIKLRNISKFYGSFCAVNDISFEVNSGEVFGFLGVNGAGKTTTLKMLSGILQPNSGELSIGGHSVVREPVQAKAITGYIPDRPYIYSKLSGREFLRFVADLYKVEKTQIDDRIDQLLDDYSLTEWQYELVESYSHGMRQRLATIAALIHKPKALIIDEPMVGLDPHGAKMLKSAIRQYASEGMAILLSTHSLNVAQEVCDRLAIIHQGSIISTGTFEELRDQSGSDNASELEQVFLALTDKSSFTTNDDLYSAL